MKLNGSVAYQNIVGLSRFICRKTAIITWFTQQKYLCFLTKDSVTRQVCWISWWGVLHISSTARGEPWISSPVVLLGWQVVVRFTFFWWKFTFCCHKNQSSKQWRADILHLALQPVLCLLGMWDEKITSMCVYIYTISKAVGKTTAAFRKFQWGSIKSLLWAQLI